MPNKIYFDECSEIPKPGIYVQLKMLYFTWFFLVHDNRRGWLRLFGYGILWKDTTRHAPLFSERNGLTKSIRIGKWYFKILEKWPD